MATVGRRFAEANFPRVLDLLGACSLAGYVDAELLSTNIRLTLSNPAFDLANTRVIDGEGGLLAFALLWQGRVLGMLVHPDHRGEIEPGLIDWAGWRHGSQPGSPPLIALCRNDDELMIRLLERSGFALHEEELRLGRDLDGDIPACELRAGFTIRPLVGDAELDDWLALYAEAFGPRQHKLRHWRVMRDDPDHRAELDLVAVTDDGRLAGFCYCSIAGFEASILPRVEGRTEPIAVGRQYRRQGLGRALVAAGLHALRQHGADSAMLTTEADNVAAHELYASLGYREWYRARWYSRSPAGTATGDS